MSLTPRLFAHAQLDEFRVELQRQEQLRHMKRTRERLEEQREKVGLYRCLRSCHRTETCICPAAATCCAPGCMRHIISRVVLARGSSSSSATSCCADEQQDASSMCHAECCVRSAVNTKMPSNGLKLRRQRNRQRARRRHADEPKLAPSAPQPNRVLVW